MYFGPLPLEKAEGAILAHSIKLPEGALRKGQTLNGAALARLRAADITSVVVAVLEADDLSEDDAAARIGNAMQGPGLSLGPVTTGRVNLIAQHSGIIRFDAGMVHAVNAIDDAVTLAILPDFSRVEAGQLVATVKIIPFGVAMATVDAAVRSLGAVPISLHAFRGGTAQLVMTATPGFRKSLLQKGERAMRERLHHLGYDLKRTEIVAHSVEPVAEAIGAKRADLTLILGASATSDRRDVAPSAVIAAGGTIERFGMPVDPGNLLFVGQLDGNPVVGLPGCARSPALNGVDWVLERLSAGIAVTSSDIARMGVGGLLKEMPDRPSPRRGG